MFADLFRADTVRIELTTLHEYNMSTFIEKPWIFFMFTRNFVREAGVPLTLLFPMSNNTKFDKSLDERPPT